jgi:hypothetical protein
MAKATFSLDEQTLQLLRSLAERKHKAQSHILREAVAVYAAQGEVLSDQERSRKLRMLDQLAARPSARTAAAVDDELREVRRGRRVGWRRRSD